MEFSNPLPPPTYQHQTSKDEEKALTNDDFRKLMMTPRAPGSAPPAAAAASHKLKRQDSLKSPTEPTNNAAEERRKRKIYFAKLKKLEDEKQKELDSKYRDRAKERRDGKYNDDPQEISTTADYRAVAPELKLGTNQAEKRRQIIEESKYLGGDMEHTHLVKGLDYALLEKVRAEINNKEDNEDDIELALEKKDEERPDIDEGEELSMRTALAKNIYRTVFQNTAPVKNEMFAPGRMAYVIDLEEEYAESDIPTTAIRSKADCPALPETTTLSTNDIVISKLTQILSYLRQGKRDRKKQKKDAMLKGKEEQLKELMKPKDDVDIFGEAMSSRKEASSKSDSRGRDRKSDRTRDRSRERDRGRDRRRDRDRDDRGHEDKKSYFEKPVDKEDLVSDKDRRESTQQFIKGLSKQYAQKWSEIDETGQQKTDDKQPSKTKRKAEIDHYAECYPGMSEAIDAIDDSDEEVDYTKMDMGNKKGPVNRWDFENNEQYQEYMSKKEALPKAAFQYGVKMSDGRKTRRAGPKDDKAALDREWQQIQNIMSKNDGKSSAKKAKY